MEQVFDIPALPQRKKDSHKGSFGKICVIGGSAGMAGAAALAGRAALRSGAGLVRGATAKSVVPIVATAEPCYTTIALPEDKTGKISSQTRNKIPEIAQDNDVIAFGPGLGVSNGVRDVLRTLIALENHRIVVDADGLNCLAKIPWWEKDKKASMILTPHPGEIQRLWAGINRTDMPSDRAELARTFAKRSECTVVLKGNETVVAGAEKFYLNKTGNPGMATAGSGDVLTGVIAAFAGQGLDNFDAAVLGVYIHGLAGDIAAKEHGQVSLIATDIIQALSKAFMGS